MRPALALLSLQPAWASPVVVPLTRRPGVGQGERRRLSQIDEARLYGNLHGLMSYHVDVLVGTPGQMQSVIVDTGSAMTAFPCTACGTNCGRHIDPPFDPQNSSTFRWVSCSEARCRQCSSSRTHCQYSVSYVEGSSISGSYFEDVLHLGHAERSNSMAPVWLGCHTRETNLFLRQEPSGIMGVGEDNWDVLTALMGGPLEKRIIGLCLSDDGGVMSLGGINESWTPLDAPLQRVPYGFHYSVSVTGATLVGPDGQTTDLATLAGTYAVDSGTTFTYMSTSQAAALRLAVQNACGRPYTCGAAAQAGGNCWLATEADLHSFPDLHIRLGEATFVWSPRGYLSSRHAGHWCYTFHGEPPLTLGASFMRNHLVVFDREERKIGFAPSPCPSIRSRGDVAPVYAGGPSPPPPVVSSRTMPSTTPLLSISAGTAGACWPSVGFVWLSLIVRALLL